LELIWTGRQVDAGADDVRAARDKAGKTGGFYRLAKAGGKPNRGGPALPRRAAGNRIAASRALRATPNPGLP
jgi:hypothetical protein